MAIGTALYTSHRGLCSRARFLWLLPVVIPWTQQMRDVLLVGSEALRQAGLWGSCHPRGPPAWDSGKGWGQAWASAPASGENFAQRCFSFIVFGGRTAPRLWKVWEMSPSLPRAARSPAGTQAGGDWEPGLVSEWGGHSGFSTVHSFIHSFTQQ